MPHKDIMELEPPKAGKTIIQDYNLIQVIVVLLLNRAVMLHAASH